MYSTSKGFLPPRVALTSTTDATTILNPTAGLIVYNSATAGTSPNNVIPGLYLFSGSKWNKLSVETKFSLVIYTNATNPNTATIFDTENPAVTNTSVYKDNANNLYIGTDGSSWTYNPTSALYVTYSDATNTPFYLTGTTVDAVGNKTTAIYRTGSIGIGTSTPAFNLDVNGTGRFNSDIYTGSSLRFNASGLNTNYKLYSNSDGELMWQTATASTTPAFSVSDAGTRFTLFNAKANSYYNGTGNFGVGLTAPAAKFVVNETSYISSLPTSSTSLMNNASYKAVSRTQVTSGSANNALSSYITTSAVAQQAHNYSTGATLPYILQPAGGGIGIGPLTALSAILQVHSTSNTGMPTDAATILSTNPLVKFQSTNGGISFFSSIITPYAFGIQVHDLTSGTPVPLSLQPVSGKVGVNNIIPAYTLDVTGTINASIEARSAAFVTTSDSRLKKNISDFQNGISTIMQLHPVSYDKKTSIQSENYSIKEIGFVAQEIEKVLPELISVGNDEEKTLGVNYIELIPILTKAIQEQQKEILDLKNKINALENRK